MVESLGVDDFVGAISSGLIYGDGARTVPCVILSTLKINHSTCMMHVYGLDIDGILYTDP